MAALAVGIGGVIPAILVTVKGVRKERRERWEPSQPIRISAKERRALELAEAGTGLVRRSRSGFRVGMPAVTVSTGVPAAPATSAAAPLRERSELRLSLASGVF